MDVPNKLFVILPSSVIRLSIYVLGGHILLTGWEGGEIQAESLFSFSVWKRCVTFAQFIFIRKPTLGGGGGWGEEVVRIPIAAYQSAILCTSRMLWQSPGP